MTSHELARKLMMLPDYPVVVWDIDTFDSGIGEYTEGSWHEVATITEYQGEIQLNTK